MAKAIISLEKAKNYLRIDGEDCDEEILDAIFAAQDYLFNATGKHWEEDATPNPTAIMAVKLQLHLDFFKSADALTVTRLTSRIKQLQLLV